MVSHFWIEHASCKKLLQIEFYSQGCILSMGVNKCGKGSRSKLMELIRVCVADCCATKVDFLQQQLSHILYQSIYQLGYNYTHMEWFILLRKNHKNMQEFNQACTLNFGIYMNSWQYGTTKRLVRGGMCAFKRYKGRQ